MLGWSEEGPDNEMSGKLHLQKEEEQFYLLALLTSAPNPSCRAAPPCSSATQGMIFPGVRRGCKYRGTQGKEAFCAWSGRILPSVLVNLSNPIQIECASEWRQWAVPKEQTRNTADAGKTERVHKSWSNVRCVEWIQITAVLKMSRDKVGLGHI